MLRGRSAVISAMLVGDEKAANWNRFSTLDGCEAA